MADHQDMSNAEATYGNFIGLFKWGAIATAITVALVVLIIA